MLKYRVISSTLIIVLLLAVALWTPARWLTPVVALIGALAAWEFSGFLTSANMVHERALGIAGGVGWLLLVGWGGSLGAEAELLMLLVLVTGTALTVMARRDGNPLTAVPATLLVILYAPFLLSFILRLLNGLGGDGRYLVLYMILVVKITDMGAYFIGSAYGRHKAFPRISPAKSWEGCAGGVAVATLVSVGTVWAVGGDFGVARISLMDGMVLGILLAVTGIYGDLLESMFKRAAGVKDSGTWIRGMGGILDVIDSLILAGPVLYVYLRLIHS